MNEEFLNEEEFEQMQETGLNTQNNTQNFDVSDNGKKLDPEEFEAMKNELEKMKSELQSSKEAIKQTQAEKFFTDEMEKLKKEFKDFDAEIVVDEIKKIHEENPALAEQYNTPIGFRAIWLQIQNQKAQDEEINKGKASDGDDFDELYDGAMKGKSGALKKAISLAV